MNMNPSHEESKMHFLRQHYLTHTHIFIARDVTLTEVMEAPGIHRPLGRLGEENALGEKENSQFMHLCISSRLFFCGNGG